MKYLAEFSSTFLLVFFGTGSIVADQLQLIDLGNFGIALVFGLLVALLIFIFGKISGAHMNPAVSLGLAYTGNLKKQFLIKYWIAQFSGAILASLLIKSAFPQAVTLGNTLPQAGILWSSIIEFGMSFTLMLLILILIKKEKHLALVACFVGILIFLEAFLGGPFTGASMNPARSFGPALISGHLEHIWIYLFATSLGTLTAAIFLKKLI